MSRLPTVHTMKKTEAQKTFLLSDESRNSYGIRVLTAGIDLVQFERNPIMLHMHLRGEVIGRWINLEMKDGKLFGDPEFDLDDDFSKKIAGKVERGFLKAASIGIIIQDYQWVDEEGTNVLIVTRCQLYEASIVDVPSNSNALRLYSQDGQPLESHLTLSAHFPPVSVTPSPDTIMFSKAIALSLGLPEAATEQEINAAVTTSLAYKKQYEDLKSSTDQAQAKQADSLIQLALDEKRIKPESKDKWKARFAADFADASDMLGEMKAPTDLVQFAQSGQQNTPPPTAKTTVELAADWDRMQLDSTSPLLKLKAENFDQYSALFKAKYGSEPTK